MLIRDDKRIIVALDGMDLLPILAGRAPVVDRTLFWRIDTPTRQELIASTHTVDEIATYVTADSLGYLSLPGLYSALGEDRSTFSDACFSGEYLVAFPKRTPAPPLRVVGA